MVNGKVELKARLKEVAGMNRELARFRDRYREKVEELAAILESIDEGLEELEDGERLLRDGVAALSKYV